MTVRNGMPYLPIAVQSILNQSYKDFEFIIVNDGSTDETASYLESLQYDERVSVFHREPAGLHKALNFGLKHCRGEFIARIDADDVADTQRLGIQHKYLTRHSGCVLLGSACSIIDEYGEQQGIRYYPFFHTALVSALKNYNPFTSSSCLIRKSAIDAVGGFRTDVGFCEDYDLWIRLSKKGTIHNLPLVLTAHRLHRNAIKAKQTRRQLRDTLRLKNFAHKHYYIKETIGSLLYSLAQRFATMIPAPVIFKLWRILAVRDSK